MVLLYFVLKIAIALVLTICLPVWCFRFMNRHPNPRLSKTARTIAVVIVLVLSASAPAFWGLMTTLEYHDTILAERAARQHAEEMKQAERQDAQRKEAEEAEEHRMQPVYDFVSEITHTVEGHKGRYLKTAYPCSLVIKSLGAPNQDETKPDEQGITYRKLTYRVSDNRQATFDCIDGRSLVGMEITHGRTTESISHGFWSEKWH
jgi:hypothetical protein